MIVNRMFGTRVLLPAALAMACACASFTVSIAQSTPDVSPGWSESSDKSSTPPPAASTPSPASAPSSHNPTTAPASSTSDPRESSGWNEEPARKPSGAPPLRGTSVQPTTPAPAHGAPMPGIDASGLFHAGDTALSAGQYEQAIKAYDDAWRTIPPGKADSQTTAKFFERKAFASRGLQRINDAERFIKQALGHATTGTTRDPALHTRILFETADILSQEGLPKDGLAVAKQALTLAQSNAARGTNLEVELLNVYGRLQADTGDPAGAEESLNKALAAVDSAKQEVHNVLPASPVSRFSDHLKGKINANIAHLRLLQGNTAGSAAPIDLALQIMKGYGPGSVPDVRYSHLTLSASEELLPNEGARLNAIKAVLPEADKVQPSDNLIKAYLLTQSADLKAKKSDLNGAIDDMKVGFAVESKVLPANSAYVADSLMILSQIYLRQGQASNAANQAQRAYAALERSAGRDSLDFAKASMVMAQVYMSANKYGQLLPILNDSVKITTKIQGDYHPNTLHALDMLAAACIRNNQFDDAVKYSTRALAAGERTFGANSPKIALSLTNLGTAAAHLKQFPESNRNLQRALAILQKSGKSGTAQYADVLAALGVNNTLQKKWDSAASNLKQARMIYLQAYGKGNQHAAQMTALLKAMEIRKQGPRQPSYNLLHNEFTPMAPQYQ